LLSDLKFDLKIRVRSVRKRTQTQTDPVSGWLIR
jgi:hypothetical protein